MKRSLLLCLIAFISLIQLACTDQNGSGVSGIHSGAGITIRPRYVFLGAQAATAPISRIRLTARNAQTNAVVASKIFEVADQAEWTLDVDVPADAGNIVVLIELVSVTSGVESIEWSGETAEIHITPGTPVAPQPVTLYQGPPGNLDVISVTVTPESQTVVEGTPVTLAGAINGGGPGAKIVWSTLDPTIAGVDQNGTVTTLRNGTARVFGVAGPRADTAVIIITQRAASLALTPDTARVSAFGTDAVFVARVLDPRGGDIVGAGINWTIANGAIADNLGGGRFRAKANGTTQITATSATSPGLSRSATLIVAQRATRVQITPPAASLTAIGATQQFVASVTDGNGNTVPTPVTWRSSTPAAATIDANGLATARGAGATDISAIVNAGSPDSAVAHATLTVTQAVRSVVVTPNPMTFASIGEVVTAVAEARDANNNVVSGVAFQWTTSNGAVATVSSTGAVTAVSNGTAQITATVGTVSGSSSATVRQIARTITVLPARDSIGVGATREFFPTARDARSNVIGDAEFTWRSSDTTKATVNSSGIATARASGSALIQASMDGVTGSATLIVIQRATQAQITPPNASISAIGGTQQFTVVVRDAGGNPMAVPVTWRSSNTAVATINSNGLATATGAGTADIVAVGNAGTPDSVVAHATLQVAQAVAFVSVTPSSKTLRSIGDTVTVTAQARDANNNVINGAVFQWSSSAPGAASVNSAGLVTAVSNGFAQISATYGTLQGSSNITVSQRATQAQIAPPAATLNAVGATQQFTLAIQDARGNPVTTPVVWRSASPGVATIDANGLATATGQGTTDISAVVNAGAPDSVVSHATLQVAQSTGSVTVSPPTATMTSINDTVAATAQARDANNNPINGVTFVWSSLNPAVATVDSTGHIVARGNGTTQIRATNGAVFGSTTITVRQFPVTVTVTPAQDSVGINATRTFTATARDARNNVIGDAVYVWSSTDTTKATVNGAGTATGRRAGTTTIHAISGGIGGSATLVVTQQSTAIQITPSSATLSSLGATQQFTVRVNDANGDSMAVPVVWRSATPSVATIDANGLATAHAIGATDITAVANAGSPDSLVAHASLNVTQAIDTIVVTPPTAGFASLGDSTTLTATAYDANSNVVSGVTFQWATSNSAVATVDSAGTVRAVGNGPAQITASVGAVQSSADITVRQIVVGVVVAPAADTLAIGESQAFTATAHDQNGQVVADAVFTWQSSDTTKATVDANGLAMAHASGSVVITANTTGGTGSANIEVTDPTIANLVAVSISTPGDTINEGSDVSVSLVVRNTGSRASTLTNLRLALVEAGAPNTVLRDTVLPLPAIQPGDSLVLIGSVFGNLVGLPDSLRIAATVDDANVVPESDENDNRVVSALRFIRFLDRTWTGAVNSSWNEPGNWSPAGPPRRTSAVRILNDPSHNPVLDGNVDIASYTQDGPDIVDMGAFSMHVSGSLSNAHLTGTGTVFLTGTGSASGAITNLVVTAPVTLAGTLATTGSIDVASGGELTVNTHDLNVGGDFSTHGTGTLVMTDADDVVRVDGNVDFSGGNTEGKLTAGILFVRGPSFTAGAANAGSFSASEEHETYFTGGTAQTVSLAHPDTLPNTQHFGEIYFETSLGVNAVTDIAVLGDISFGSSTGPFSCAGCTLTTLGSIDEHLASGDLYRIANTIFGAENVEFPERMHSNVTFTKLQTMGDDTYKLIFGNVIVDGGNLDLNGSTMQLDASVPGSFSTINGGVLTMTHQYDRLRVAGNVTFNGGDENGLLTEGVIEVGMDFAAQGLANTFVAAPAHTVQMLGYDTEVHSETHIFMSSTGTNAQRFGTLEIRNPTVMTADITVAGDLLLYGYSLTGTELTATVQGDIFDGYYDGGERIAGPVSTKPAPGVLPTKTEHVRTVLNDRPRNFVPAARGQMPAGATAARHAPLKQRNASAIQANGAASAMSGGYYHVTRTVLAGDLQHLPRYIASNVDVVSAVRLTNNENEIEGNLRIVGANANLRLVGYVPELESYTAHDVYVYGNLETQSGGVLSMSNNECECYNAMNVYGNAVFNGGSTEGHLAGGILYVSGNFSASGDPQSYAADQYFNTEMLNPPVAGTTTISMSNPHNTTGQHFGRLFVNNPVDLLTNVAFVDIEIAPEVIVTGIGKTAYVSRSIYTPMPECVECTNVVAPPVGARPAKAPADQLKLAPNLEKRRAGTRVDANSAGQLDYPEPYQIENTVLNGTYQDLPSFIETNITVVSDVTLGNSDYYYYGNEIQGNVTVTGAGSSLRIGQAVDIDGDFATANGAVLNLTNGDLAQYMTFRGNVTFDGGSEDNLLTVGQIFMYGQTFTAGADPYAFKTSGTLFALMSPNVTINLAHPETQTFNSVYIEMDETGSQEISIPNGWVITESLAENTAYPPFHPHFTSPTAKQLDLGGQVVLSGASFDNVTLSVHSAQSLSLDGLTFGAYDAGADRMLVTGQPFTSVGLYSPVFDDTGTGLFIHLVGDSTDVYVFNPVPGSTTRTQVNGNNSSIIWPAQSENRAAPPIVKPVARPLSLPPKR